MVTTAFPSQAKKASFIDRHDRKLLVALAVVGLLFALSRVDWIRYHYRTQSHGPRTLTVKVDRFTGETYFLVIGQETGWRRAGSTP
jgi:hypothetical protein